MIKTVEWTSEGVRMIDQRLLPTEEKYLIFRSCEEVAEAIRQMVVRGAPAIGVAAAMGIAVGLQQAVATTAADLQEDFDYMCDVMSRTRPTAVNLFWAIERMRDTFRRAAAETNDAEEIKRRIVAEAQQIFADDIAANRALGRFGGELIPDGATVLTHCNAGALATAGDYGTALGVVRGARDAGKRVAVIADEDRIAANGDTANKIGTYMVAVLAHQHDIPFYVAAPVSTLDLNLASGEEIPIEERDPREVTHVRDQRLAPEGIEVHNPAFDVTPHELIAAIITDKGVARPPYTESLKKMLES